MTARAGFCVAEPRQLQGLTGPNDLHAALRPGAVLELQGELAALRPAAELMCLSAILAGDSSGTPSGKPPAGEPGGLNTWRVDPELLLALQGADADPEMEWEDAVFLWQRSESSASRNCDDAQLLSLIDQMRVLAGQVTGEAAFYCWWFTN